jgi:hypothetical protein
MLLPKVLRRRRTEARKTTPKRNLMKLFKRLSQRRAVDLRAAQQTLRQFARLKSSQPIESLISSLIDRPTLARKNQSVFVRKSQVRLPAA